MGQMYLRSNVMGEPLVDGWYAWSHLIPPATAARNITERHLRIMDSYIQAPDSHAAAVKDPRLLGGPFMDFEGNHVEDVRTLREKTVRERHSLVELSGAITELDDLLRAKAKGSSLECLYAEVPECLRGYVELVYDLNNQPSFRLLEPLLYNSRFYDRSMQTFRFSTLTGDDRPFVLSTPRLPNDGDLELPIAFDDERVDQLFQLRSRPASFSCFKRLLDFPDSKDDLFRTFLAGEPPRRCERYQGNGARWRYFGHACILLETKELSILLDPVLSYTYESSLSRYTYEDLPDVIDYVLITHNHQDHLLFETLLQLRHRIRTVIVPRNSGGSLQDPSLRLILKNCGFRNVVELPEMDDVKVDGGSITAIPFLGEHGDLNITTKTAYLVRLGTHSLLFAADSCNINPAMYENVHRAIGDVEVLFVGMECDGAPVSWIYGPLLTRKLERKMDQSRRLAGSNYERAMGMVDQFRCKDVYVYAMGQEPWLNYVMSLKYTDKSNPIVDSNRLIARCKERGVSAERLFGEKEILLS
jgi:L-ascorbate metabolism protein UlaG (beta-lactamase superfamily)